MRVPFVTVAFVLLPLSSLSLGCAGVDSEDEARLAYLGLDNAIERAIQLGFDGYNAASSATIPPQSDDGDESGQMDVTGKVDQGSSANKGMRLDVALSEYSDGLIDDPETEDVEEELVVVYDTDDDAPLHLAMQLKDIPDGTLEGTLVGTAVTDGDIVGEVDLDLAMVAELEPGEGGQEVQRVAGTTRITGTAASEAGEYDVDVTR